MRRILLFPLTLLLFSTLSPAEPSTTLAPPAANSSGSWSPLYHGVAIRHDRREEPRLLRITTVRVDLAAEGVELFVTPGNGDQPKEDHLRRTSSFLEEFDLEVALNATGFHPVAAEGTAVDIIGLSLSEGEVVSEVQRDAPVFYLDAKGKARITAAPFAPGQFAGARLAVQGWYGAKGMLLDEGEVVTEAVDVHPRSALGVDREGRFVYLVTFDGRRKGYSLGADLPEMARFFQELGCWQAMNLDGGGSTTLVVKDPVSGEATFANRPSGSGERAVGNHLGVQAVPEAKTGH
ncbi:phosphodiester glycosidase family protein [Roseibacillus ishigakijimensis]|uniref:Phosphodiester glycosidase family protein n=1 Tax=Roseibacillus ishigakijimensis TaxID=454146 RepID=A0A934VM40_9BACT|nr:phosphodiester glycosidase family protein [Roseibacillus ishigakijimensis]MBK1833555.1 phosphodiester glycosidase family protein [Roseibacillus ishigakijimensis]